MGYAARSGGKSENIQAQAMNQKSESVHGMKKLRDKTHSVGQKKPNALDFKHVEMYGNG